MKKLSYVLLVFCFIFTLFSPAILAEEASQTTPSNVPFDELDDFIGTYTKQYIDKTTPGASIVIVNDNTLVHSKGYGFTSTAKDTPVESSTTVFEWGSISKLFVWVAALQLVEQGKLDLELPISYYLTESEMPNLQYQEPLTMLHLMNHNAGFEEYILNLMSDSKDTVTPLSEFLKKNQPYQAYPPGKIVSYSNYSTSLAAYIIEKITNQTYEDYVKANVFIPLAMNDTIVTIANDADLEKIKTKRATGYVSTTDSEFIEMGHSYLSLYPSGSINGPATDLAKFAQALLAKTEENNLLFYHLDTLDLLYSSSYSPSQHTPGVAHGFWEYQGTYKSYSHGGNTMGFSTNFHVVPDANFAAIILTNQVSDVAISYGLMDALLTDKTIKYATIPLNKQIDYNKSFISSRNTNHTFTKLYFYLTQLTLEPDYENNYLTISFGGTSAKYEQIGENDFHLVSGPPQFSSMKNIHLNTDGSEIVNIYATYSGYYPMKISTTFIFISLAVVLILFIYMIVMSIIYLVKNKRSAQPLKSYAITMLLQIILFINTALLFIRMVIDSYRTSDELLIHIVISYSLGIITIIALINIIIQVIRSRSWMKFHFISTVFTVVIFQLIFMFWRFYSF